MAQFRFKRTEKFIQTWLRQIQFQQFLRLLLPVGGELEQEEHHVKVPLGFAADGFAPADELDVGLRDVEFCGGQFVGVGGQPFVGFFQLVEKRGLVGVGVRVLIFLFHNSYYFVAAKLVFYLSN